MSKPIPRLYIDTNVFVSFLLQGKFHSNAKNFFERIEKQAIKGVTSSINKTEFLAVFKRAYSTEHGKNPKSKLIKKTLDVWDDLISEMGLEYYESEDLIQKNEKIFRNANDIVLNSKAIKKNNKWKFISGHDAMVVMMANKTKSDGIVTDDDGYLGVNPKVNVKILREVF